jgi:putative redox protein
MAGASGSRQSGQRTLATSFALLRQTAVGRNVMNQVQVKANAKDHYRQSIKASDHAIVSDAPKEFGGKEIGPNPHELMLAALGSCTSMTMQMYAQRKEWDLQNVTVDLTEDQVEDANEPGKKVTKITRKISVDGNLTQEQIDGLKAIADKCPIHKLLSGSQQIATEINRLTSV